MKQSTTIGKLLLGVLYVSIAVAILGTAVFTAFSKASNEAKVLHKIFLAGEEVLITIADTPKLQEKGLSGKTDINLNEGVLFSFTKPGAYGFWMKDMLFPIDIIWFDANRRVVDMWEDASPDSYPNVRAPQSDSQYALEVKAGFSHMHNLRKGDQFRFVQ